MADTDGIDAALQEYVREHCPGDIITGWVLIAPAENIENPGEETMLILYQNDQVPYPMALGMIECGRLLAHKQYTDRYRKDD